LSQGNLLFFSLFLNFFAGVFKSFLFMKLSFLDLTDLICFCILFLLLQSSFFLSNALGHLQLNLSLGKNFCLFLLKLILPIHFLLPLLFS